MQPEETCKYCQRLTAECGMVLEIGKDTFLVIQAFNSMDALDQDEDGREQFVEYICSDCVTDVLKAWVDSQYTIQ